MGLLGTGVVLQTASLIYRGVHSGHIPVMGHYENASVASWFIAVPALVLALRSERYRLAALGAVPLALFVEGYALMYQEPGAPLSPPYQSSWLVIHVVFAQLAYGAYSLAAAVGIAFLLRAQKEQKGRPQGVLAKLPSPEDMDDNIFRLLLFGFVTSAMMIVVGAF